MRYEVSIEQNVLIVLKREKSILKVDQTEHGTRSSSFKCILTTWLGQNKQTKKFKKLCLYLPHKKLYNLHQLIQCQSLLPLGY